ncbi:hypothetical protein D3C77_572440 [compost metagenome]
MHQCIFSTDAGAYAEQGRMFRATGDVGLDGFNEVQAGGIGDGLFHGQLLTCGAATLSSPNKMGGSCTRVGEPVS